MDRLVRSTQPLVSTSYDGKVLQMCQLVNLRTQHRTGGVGPNFQHVRPSQRRGAAARARLESSADGAPFWSRSSIPAQGPKYQHRRPCQRRGAAVRARLESSADGAPFWARSSVPAQGVPAQPKSITAPPSSGVFSLLVLNLAAFVADHLMHLPFMPLLYLNHAAPHWWQFVTAAFAHASWEHLSSNIFMLYVFGRIVEEEEGALGVWATYLICSVGGSLASYFTMPHNYFSLGASGAVFGLFAVSVLLKLRFNFRKLVECLVLGQFVVNQLIHEVTAQAAITTGRAVQAVGGTQIGHIAHLGGALAGVLLIVALSRLPGAAEPSA